MIIDAHQHVWDPARADYPWLTPALAPIDRAFGLEEALTAMAKAGVGATVLVQAADNAADTRHMLAVADRHPEVVGVVGWVPLDQPDVAADQLAELRLDPRVLGIRNLIHDRPDPDWILRPDVDAGLGVLEQADVPFDYVTSGPGALAHLPAISARHPRLRLVIDHLGKPPIGGDAGARKHWRGLLTEAARNPRVVAKLSGLYSAVGPLDAWSPELVRPFVDDALEVFGPDRLMFGSDWPISVLAGGYERVWDAVTGFVGGLAPAERAAILGGTAASFYRIDLPHSSHRSKGTP